MNKQIALVGCVVLSQNPVLKSFPAKSTIVVEFLSCWTVKDYSKKGQSNDVIFFGIKVFDGQVVRVMEYVTKRARNHHQRACCDRKLYSSRRLQVLKYVVILNGFHLYGSKSELNEIASENTVVAENAAPRRASQRLRNPSQTQPESLWM